MSKYTDEELAVLSPTEREALTAVDEDEDTLNDLAGDEDDSDEEEDNSDNDSDDKAAEDKSSDDEKNDADDNKDVEEIISTAEDLDVDLDDIPPVPFKAVFTADLSDKYQAEIDALETKLYEGEISPAEYRKAERQIVGNNLAEINAQIEWKAEQEAFFKANKQFSEKTDPDAWAKLNAEVIKVANSGRNLTGIQILYAAKQNIDEAADFAAFRAARKAGKSISEAAADVAKKTTDSASEKKTIPAKPSSKRPDIQTLRGVPAADAAEVGQDKFAHLDQLSGLALEAAVSQLSPTDKRAYLEGV